MGNMEKEIKLDNLSNEIHNISNNEYKGIDDIKTRLEQIEEDINILKSKIK